MLLVLLNALLFLAGFLIMIRGAEAFIDNVAKLGRKVGMKPVLVGLSVIAFGTSMPELFISVFGALRESSQISIGNVVGSNIANIGLFLGFAGFITVQTGRQNIFTRELPFMILVVLLFYIFSLDGLISTLDGIVLLVLFAGYIAYVFKTGMHHPDDPVLQELVAETRTRETKTKLSFFTFLGLAGLLLGSSIIVDTGIEIASFFGIPEAIIALTAMAFGTSIPEITSSLVALKKGERELAYGGIIGSIIFNTLLIVGVASMILHLTVEKFLITDGLIMVVFAVFMLPFTLTGWKMTKWKSATILSLYAAYVIYIFVR